MLTPDPEETKMEEGSSTILDLEKRMADLETRYLGFATPTPKRTPFAPTSVAAQKIKEISDGSFGRDKPHITTKLPMLQPLSFNGIDLDDFFDEFSRWLRLSGVFI